MKKYFLLLVLIMTPFPILAILIGCPSADNDNTKITTARLFSVVSGQNEKAEQMPYYLSNKKYGWDLQTIENESFLLTCIYQNNHTINKKLPPNLKRCFYSSPKDKLTKEDYEIICDDVR